MKPMFKSALAVIVGLVFGGAVNMATIMIGGYLIAPPPGAETTTMDGLKASIHLFEPKHFLFPFLAHALGTLVGAYLAARLAAGRKLLMAMIVGVAFLAGGLVNVLMLPAPIWFNAVDILFAYIPMAWLGAVMATKRRAFNPDKHPAR